MILYYIIILGVAKAKIDMILRNVDLLFIKL